MPDDPFNYDARLPEGIRNIGMGLRQDVAYLHHERALYLELFSDPGNAALLTDLARSSFQIIEESLRNNLTMAICRLSDPAQSPGEDNLSFATLVNLCDDIPSTKDALKDFHTACKPIRDLRN